MLVNKQNLHTANAHAVSQKTTAELNPPLHKLL